MADWSDEKARMQAERIRLDLRIHNQRKALRENWMITETRLKARSVCGRSRWLETCLNTLRKLRETEAKHEAANAAAYQRGRESVLDQLREPGEELVKAGWLAHLHTPRFFLRALAAALAEKRET